jgi:hypothetical protein
VTGGAIAGYEQYLATKKRELWLTVPAFLLL